MAKLSELTSFLNRLDSSAIHYTLSSVRDHAILVGVSVPGERWEIEFMAEGQIEIEVFKSDGTIRDCSVIEELFRQHSE